MATVNKDFRIKSGLIVEGSTATVNSYDILTKSNADQSYITALVGGSGESLNVADTLVLRDSNGDFAAGTITADLTGDVTGNLTGDVTGNVTGNVTGDLTGSVTGNVTGNLTGDVTGDVTGNVTGNLTGDVTGNVTGNVTGDLTGDVTGNVTGNVTGDVTGTVSDISNHSTTDLSEGSNLYFTDQRAIDANTGLWDASGDAAAAESNANSYTDSLIGDVTVDGSAGNTVKDRIDTAVADLVASAPAALDTLNELAAALGDDANFVTTVTTSIGEKVAKAGDTMTGALTLSGAPTLANHAATKQYVDDAEAAANSYTDGEIATLSSTVGALDTDDVAEGSTNLYFTDERAQDAFGALLSGGTQTNITVTYDDAAGTVSFVAENGVADSTTDDLTEGSTNLYFTNARAQAAVAQDITDAIDALDTDDIEEGASNLYFTDARAQAAVASDIATAVAAGDATATPTYEAVDVNSVSKVVATTQTVATASQVVALDWAIADYASAELIVKVSDGTDSEVSKVLLTLDSSNNIAITQYGTVLTNESLSTITAGINGSNVEVKVTTANNNSDVVVAGTLLI